MKKPELLSPIQDFTSLSAALEAGADAVFFGVIGFNMRATAKNFTQDDISRIVEQCKEKGVKAYIALNTIVYDEEMGEVRSLLEVCKKAGIDAVICWDFAVIALAKEIGLQFHISTQASIANVSSAQFYKDLGAERIVLARECTLEQVREIQEKVDIEIETFVHGAMCVSISGRCFMSQFVTCHSANRGACRQPCRRNYMITDTEGEYEFEVGPNYVLSPQDVCTLPFLEELIFAGIDCFKIEGRNKSPEYVRMVTSVYREVIDYIWEHREERGTHSFAQKLQNLKEKNMKNLEKVFNRGFSSGFYMGKPLHAWTDRYGSVATERKIFLGKIVHLYKKIGVVEVKIETNESLSVGDEVYIEGPTTGIVRSKVQSLEIEHVPVESASQGNVVAMKVEGAIHINDRVSKISTASESLVQ